MDFTLCANHFSITTFFVNPINPGRSNDRSDDIPVKNVHLFCNANPGGYFTLTAVDQPFVQMDANNIDISIDDVSPGSHKEINLFLEAPMPGQIQGEWSHNFHYDFTIKHDVAPKSPAGTIILTARHGKILVQQTGFGQ